MNSFSAISIHNCCARTGVAAQAAAAEKLVYHLNKQSLGDHSAISTNSMAEFSLAGKAGCWKGSAPAFELIIPGRIDKWLDAHIIKQPARLLNLDIYISINSFDLPCMKERHTETSPEYCGIHVLTLQSKMVASRFYMHFKAVKEVGFPAFFFFYTHTFFHLRGMKSSSHLFFQLCCITIFKFLCEVCHAIQQLIKLLYIVLYP